LINSFLRQEDLETNRNETLKSLIFTNQEYEEEMNRILKQEQALNRETATLELERTLKVRNEFRFSKHLREEKPLKQKQCSIRHERNLS
jgi:hypothetical protein